MQVADNHELTTSATLGGKQAISFGISDDPAFFHVLSSSLYNNPNLAVVRETICNSWDAHIEAGLKDLPIRITIDENNFITFRDFGHGIPTDKIGQVYGTYGASTKKANSNVTGGFGLGCKSPFAYTDSFQVTSWNQGKMSIYNVTKSSVETDGKPGIIPIVVDAVTDQSGLEVKFQLRPEDLNEFVRYIKSIVFNGEIKAILCSTIMVNDEAGGRKLELRDQHLPVMGMSFEPGSYDMSDNWHMPYMGHAAVYIRYGNVMYPAINSPATEEALGIIHNFMNVIGASRIVVQAAPSTLAIAPSRETLSNQKMTDDGIVDICVTLIDALEKEIKAKIPKAIQEIKDGIATSNDFSMEGYPDYINTYVSDRAASMYMRSSLWRKQRYHYKREWANLDNKRFFEWEMFKGIKLNKRLALVALKMSRKSGYDRFFMDYMYRNHVYPVIAKWKQEGLHWSGHLVCRWRSLNLVKGSLLNFTRGYSDLSVLQTTLTKNVVVTRRMSDCADSFSNFPDYSGIEWREKCHTISGYSAQKTAHIIHVGAKKGEADTAVSKYTAMGYRVIDLTKVHDWDVAGKVHRNAIAMAAATRAKKAAALLAAGMDGSAPNRLISVNCVLGERARVEPITSKITKEPYISGDFARPETWKQNNHVDVENPQYYVLQKEIGSGLPVHNPRIGSMHTWDDLTDEIKAVTIVCRNKVEVNKATARGAIHLDDKRYKEVMGVIKTKEFKKYVTEQREGILESFGMSGGSYQKLFKLLDIKSKVLDRLTTKPEFEWAYQFLSNLSWMNTQNLISMKCIANEEEIRVYVPLTHLNSFKHLQEILDIKGIFYDSRVGGFLYNTDAPRLLQWLEEHPEDIPGYKTLIRNCLTKRKGIYTR